MQEKVITKEVKEEIHDLCDSRWDYYKKQDGAYYPSKHDDKVFADVAEHFCITSNEAENYFNEIAKEKAEAQLKGMSKAQMVKMFDEIVKGNAETPWGQIELNKKKDN